MGNGSAGRGRAPVFLPQQQTSHPSYILHRYMCLCHDGLWGQKLDGWQAITANPAGR